MDKNIVKSKEGEKVIYINAVTKKRKKAQEYSEESILDNDEMSPDKIKVRKRELPQNFNVQSDQETSEDSSLSEKAADIKAFNELKIEMKNLIEGSPPLTELKYYLRIIIIAENRDMDINELKDQIRKIMREEIAKAKGNSEEKNEIKNISEETTKTKTISEENDERKEILCVETAEPEVICEETAETKTISEKNDEIKEIFYVETDEPKVIISEETAETKVSEENDEIKEIFCVETAESKVIICEETTETKTISEKNDKRKEIICVETTEPKVIICEDIKTKASSEVKDI